MSTIAANPERQAINSAVSPSCMQQNLRLIDMNYMNGNDTSLRVSLTLFLKLTLAPPCIKILTMSVHPLSFSHANIRAVVPFSFYNNIISLIKFKSIVGLIESDIIIATDSVWLLVATHLYIRVHSMPQNCQYLRTVAGLSTTE